MIMSICSFAVTENYVVMCHWPATIKAVKLVLGQRLLPALDWQPAAGTKFHVIDRKRGGRGLIAIYKFANFSLADKIHQS